MRHISRFPKLIGRARFQGRTTVQPRIHRLPPPTHRLPLPEHHQKLCPYWGCSVNAIWETYHQRTMKQVDGKLKEFGKQFEDLKSAPPAKKTVVQMIRDLSVDKIRSILFDYALAHLNTIVVSIISLMGLVEWVNKELAKIKDLQIKTYRFMKEFKELEGTVRDLVAAVKDFKTQVDKLEKEMKNTISISDWNNAASAPGAAVPGA